MMIYINGRFLKQQVTGVQRFAIELSSLLIRDSRYKIIAPKKTKLIEPFNTENTILIGPENLNAWEQFFLPLFLIKKNNPLLVNFTGLGPVFYKNKIVTIHDLSFMENPKWFSKKYAFIYKILTPISANNSRLVLTVSNHSKIVISNKLKINNSKIEVIYNAVNTTLLKESIIKKKRYVLAVGTLDPRKNIERLINAFIKWNNNDYKLIIIGGNQKQFNKTNYSINKNIKILGYVSENDLSEFYQSAEMFIYPSLYEGFGIPPLEAMIHGIPVIASSTTSLPEVCGEAAFYINPYSEESIINAFKILSKNKNLQNELILKGFVNLKRFSWEKSAQKVIEITQRIKNEGSTYR